MPRNSTVFLLRSQSEMEKFPVFRSEHVGEGEIVNILAREDRNDCSFDFHTGVLLQFYRMLTSFKHGHHAHAG